MAGSRPWHEDDEFWTSYGTRTDVTPEEVDAIVRLLDVAPGAAILDMPCGSGRHAVAIAGRGYRVTGVDRTGAFLDAAKARAAEVGAAVELVRDDMRGFVRADAFDGAICMFTSLGYFEDIEDDRRVVANFYRSLVPGGRLVVDLIGKEIIARIFSPREWQEDADGTVTFSERKVTRHWSWFENRRVVVKKSGERRELAFAHRLYSAIELIGLVESVGFSVVDVFGNVDGTAPYDPAAHRLVVVAKK